MRILLAVLLLVAGVLVAVPHATAMSGPTLPCQSGIAGTDCTVGALDCYATVGYRTGSGPYEYAKARCIPPLWSGCTLLYVDTQGNVDSCLVA